ncbi:hypothetical protein PHLGIDRAFT_34899 [Phlebiopsis gigantea 11061_1 CR5-6]|uniref:Aquaporin n=1 Tax=Phlebiopsis gigantea (strain 11061_1 CR5-6) TaxID=745531 RepID=A0A0C3S0V0_PHLG1|nr:hypothetical protein PHLGIDRAFT_34899 [Phlebiopsis gigantea 11061_1 CR5-6]
MAHVQDPHTRTLQVEDLERTETKVHESTVVVEVCHLEEEEASTLTRRWSVIRDIICEPVAEFFGVMILVIFGAGVNCQVTLSNNLSVSASPKGDYLSVCFGWAAGIALGAWVSGGISGGHINPAVTLAFATLRDFPWRKVPAYILAQILGGICGAGIVYANYIHAIDAVEGGRNIRTVPGTAGLFGTYAADYMTAASAFFEEFLGTTILLLVICAVTDKRNSPPPAGLVPLVLFVTLLGISAALGMQTGFALNPARDFGPRVLTAMVGYGKEVFNFRSQYWLWCPIMAPILGALVGTFAYDAFFFRGSESILNRRRKNAPDSSDKSTAELSV